jgi:cell division protein DivIC
MKGERALATAKQPKKTTADAGTKRRMKLWFLIVALFMSWSVYKFATQIGEQGAADRKLAEVQSKIDEANKQIDDLKLQVDRLNDKEYIAQKATKEQGMLKKGEKQIQPVE